MADLEDLTVGIILGMIYEKNSDETWAERAEIEEKRQAMFDSF